MYLSTLLIDVGKNPDRPRPGRSWLRNFYRVHQRLCMAFPSTTRKSDDGDFLRPYEPEDNGSGQVHVERKTEAGFLFGIDPRPGGGVVILVQFAVRPDWDYAFHNARHLLSAPPEFREFEPSFTKGQALRFRLVANPTRRLSPRSIGADGNPVRKGVGKRVPVPSDQLHEWLCRRAEEAGFAVDGDSVAVQPGYVYVNEQLHGKGHRPRSVRYDGTLKVTEPDRFMGALVRGIGPAKAFGLGMPSAVPVSSPVAEAESRRPR